MVNIGDKIYKNDTEQMGRYTKVANECTANHLVIVDKGEYFEIEAIPEPALEELKAAKLLAVDAWTARKIVGGFTSSCSGEQVTYDSDTETQITMQGIALNVNSALFAEKYPTGCPVRGYPQGSDTKQIYMLSPDQVMLWQADLSIHIGTCKQEGWEKQAEVAAAQSKEDLDAIVLEVRQ